MATNSPILLDTPGQGSARFWSQREAAARGFRWPGADAGAARPEAHGRNPQTGPNHAGELRSETVPLNQASRDFIDAVGANPLGKMTVAVAGIALVVSRYLNCRSVPLWTPPLAASAIDAGPETGGEPESGTRPVPRIPLVLELDPEATAEQYLSLAAESIEDSYSADPPRPGLQIPTGIFFCCPTLHLPDLHLHGLHSHDLHLPGLSAASAAVPDASALELELDLEEGVLRLRYCPAQIGPLAAAGIVRDLASATGQLRNLGRTLAQLNSSEVDPSKTYPSKTGPSKTGSAENEPLEIDPTSPAAARLQPQAGRNQTTRRERTATPVERELQSIWGELFGLERAGLDDSFLDLGGDSLTAARLVSRAWSRFGAELGIDEVFEAPTIARLAAVIASKPGRSSIPEAAPEPTSDARSEAVSGAMPETMPAAMPEATPDTEAELQPARATTQPGFAQFHGDHGGGDSLPLSTTNRLSHAQRRLWFLAQMDGASAAYHIASVLRLTGDLDCAALEQSFADLIARQDALRMVFPNRDGEVFPEVLPATPFQLPVIDGFPVPASPRETVRNLAERLAGEETARPFDLSSGPLFRAALFRVSADEHILALSMHHIVSDGWSMGVMVGELCAFYAARRSGATPALAPLPVAYSGYQAWQRDRVGAEVRERKLAYWLERLRGAPELLELPTDHPRPALQSYRGGLHRFSIDAPLAARLRQLARDESASLFMVLLSAFAVLLSRWSRQEDLVIGVPVANRGAPELEPLIGLFVNTLALRIDATGSPTFGELIRRVKTASLGAFDHQEIPFEEIVSGLNLRRATAQTPLFQVMFAYENTAPAPPPPAGLHIEPVEAASGTAKFDLTLYVEESKNAAEEEAAGELAAALEYNSDLFDRATIERTAERLVTLLDALTQPLTEDPKKDPQDPSSVRPAAEARLLCAQDEADLACWNETARAYPAATLHGLIEAQVARTPDAVAATAGEEQLTYAELNDRANRLARYIREIIAGTTNAEQGSAGAAGTRTATPVGVALERSCNMIVALLAVLKAGAAYVPIDPEYPAERIAHMLAESGAPVVLTEQDLLGRLPQPGPDCAADSVPRMVCLERDWETIRQSSGANPDWEVHPGDLAYIIFTSGSTGGPKGAMNEHRGIVNRLLWMQETYRLTPSSRVLQKTPFSFDVSVWELFWPLLTGARLVFAKPGGHRDSLYLARLIQRERITTLHFVPSMLRVFLEEPEAARCPSLRHVISSGEALPTDLQERFFAVFGDAAGNGFGDGLGEGHENAGQADGPELHNLYGPTEAAVDVTYWRCRPEAGRASVPIGRPVANTQIHIVDPQLMPVPPGFPGELLIGGVQVGRGYINRPELTQAKFLPDHIGSRGGSHSDSPTASRLYRTGDLARFRADGAIEFLGRIDHQVKIRGFRIEPGEIENVLRSHPGVKDCAVLAREQDGTNRLVAYLVFAGEPVADTELRAWVKSHLPDYMTPSWLVGLPQLPLLPNGKLDRRALPHPATRPLPVAAAVEAPRNATEQGLVDIWEQVLGLHGIGTGDNFFALGGDSILSLQVVARARQAGILLTTAQLFQHQSIRELAAAAGTAADSRTIDIEVAGTAPIDAAPTGPFGLTPIQQWFLEQEQPNPDYFHQSVLLQVPAGTDAGALERALEAVCERHDALRLRFSRISSSKGGNGSKWVQHIATGEPAFELETATIPADEADRAARHLDRIALAAERAIRLTGPLLQARLIQIEGRTTWRLFLAAHHLAIDAVSWRVLLEDLYSGYRQTQRGQAILLPQPTASFRQWAASLEQLAASGALESETGYWQRPELAAAGPLPPDAIVPGNSSAARDSGSHQDRAGEIRSHAVSLDASTTTRLLTTAHAAFRTRVEDLLLAALGLALGEVRSGPDAPAAIRVDLEGHGREPVAGQQRLDVSRTIGWFTTIYPVALELRHSGGLAGQIKRVKEQLRAIPNRGSGYGILRQFAGPGWGAQPRANVLFNYLGQTGRALASVEGWGPAPETAGAGRAPEHQRTHAVEIIAAVEDGQLTAEWSYNPALHRPETIQRLAAQFIAKLEALLAHCLASEGGLTPSDVSAAGLDQAALDGLLSPGAESGTSPIPADVYRLSPLQQGMLFHSLLEDGSTAYVEQLSCTIEDCAIEDCVIEEKKQGDREQGGPSRLDPVRFRAAWQRAVAKHPALRTRFRWTGLPHPVQIVEPPTNLERGNIEWTELDWSSVPREEEPARFEQFLAADRARGFDLAAAPPLRCTFIRTGAGRYRFCWSHHHILLDGWSASIVLNDVFEEYHRSGSSEQAAVSTREQRGTAPPYRRYIEWLLGQDQAAAAAFWKAELAGFTTPSLVASQSRPDTSERGVGVAYQQLGEQLSARLTARARERRVTVNTLVAGAWAHTLSRVTGNVPGDIIASREVGSHKVGAREAGSSEVVFGLTVSGRPATLDGVESMVGLFINTVPVRVALPEQQPVSAWLASLHSRSAAWSEYSFASLAEIQAATRAEIQAGTRAGNQSQTQGTAAGQLLPGMPLFDNILVFEDYPVAGSSQASPPDSPEAPRWTVSGIESREESGYPLTVAVIPGPSIEVRARFDRSHLSAPDVRRMLSLFAATLASIAEDPDQPAGNLPAVCPADLERLARWNRPGTQEQASAASDEPFPAQFERCVQTAPGATALICGSESLTFDELNRRANRLARYLVRQGVGPEAPVALCFARSTDMIVALLAVWKAGGAYVPIDPRNPAARIAWMLADSGARLVLTHRAAAAELPGSQRDTGASTQIDPVFIDQADGAWATEPDTNLNLATGPRQLAYLIYTSGSTGRPKGVMVEHGSVSNLIAALKTSVYENAPAGLRIGLNGPLSFDTSVKQIVQLASGHTLVILPEEARADREALLAYLETQIPADGDGHHLDSLDLTPTQLAMLAGGESPGYKSQGRNSQGCKAPDGLLHPRAPVRRLLLGGEPVSPKLWDRLRACPDVASYNLYGPTEATVDATVERIAAGRETPAIGKPLANVQTWVLDAARRPLPVGTVGELYIGGSGVARGYANDPQLTAERFPTVALPGGGEARLYRTGDLARYAEDGTLEFIGRVDSQIKLRGYRVEPAEIERVLEMSPAVARAAVAVRNDDLIAYLVPANGPIDRRALRASLKAQLPPHMVPSRLVTIERLPVTAHGKTDYAALPVSDPAPVEHPESPRPWTGFEQRLLPLWREALGGGGALPDDHFFEQGGHSLTALQLMSQVEREFGTRLPIGELFRHPTLESLAARLHAAEAGNHAKAVNPAGAGDGTKASDAEDTLVLLRPGAAGVPLFLLPGAGGNVIYYQALARRMEASTPVWGLQAPGLDGSAPCDSVEKIAEQHIEQIRRIAPHGPYRLAGHSFGGKVAFEMSQQLRRAGEEVALLAILDTPAPDPAAGNSRAGWDQTQWLAAVAYEAGVFLGTGLGVTREDLSGLDEDRQLDLIAERIRSHSRELSQLSAEALLAQLRVYKTNFSIRYTPREPAELVPIALFQATEAEEKQNEKQNENEEAVQPAAGSDPSLQDATWGWQRYSSSQVQIVPCPGNHISMLLEPHVEAVARALNRAFLPATATPRAARLRATAARKANP